MNMFWYEIFRYRGLFNAPGSASWTLCAVYMKIWCVSSKDTCRLRMWYWNRSCVDSAKFDIVSFLCFRRAGTGATLQLISVTRYCFPCNGVIIWKYYWTTVRIMWSLLIFYSGLVYNLICYYFIVFNVFYIKY